MRHPRIAFLTALSSGLVVASTTIAGGWAQVALDRPPVDPPAGTGVEIGFEVRQHGETPVSWPDITVVASNRTSGDVVRTPSTPEGAAGHYVATITFPVEGSWTITFESADLLMSGTASIAVVAPIDATQPAPATSPEPEPLALGALAALMAALAGGFILRARRGPRRGEPATLTS